MHNLVHLYVKLYATASYCNILYNKAFINNVPFGTFTIFPLCRSYRDDNVAGEWFETDELEAVEYEFLATGSSVSEEEGRLEETEEEIFPEEKGLEVTTTVCIFEEGK